MKSHFLASNPSTRELAKQLTSKYRALFGPRSTRDLMVSAAVKGFALVEWVKIRYISDVPHPDKNLLRYRWDESDEDLSVCMKPALAPET